MKVLIFAAWPVKAWRISDAHVARVRERFPDIEFVHARNVDEAKQLVVDVDASLSPFLTPEMVASAPGLRWVHSTAAAVEGLLPRGALAERNIVVTNARGVQAIPMAEHVMGGLLVLSHRFDRMLVAQKKRRWIQDDLADDWPWLLHGKRMTIVGLGSIGTEIAKRAHAFGMRVTGVRRRPDQPKPSFVDEVVGPDRLENALRGADVLVLSAPGIGSTHRMIGAQQIGSLKQGAVLVNVARAQIVDDSAMRAALESGQLGGAVLDVFEHEPLEDSNPLWTTPNVVITPHSSGFRRDHWDEVVDQFCDNLRRYLRGEPLENLVDLEAGY